MVQVNGICRLETHRFSSDLDARVKYSTSCPSRRDAPSDAKRAIPISLGLSEGASKGREVIEYSPFVRLQYAFPGKLVKRGKSGRNGRSGRDGGGPIGGPVSAVGGSYRSSPTKLQPRPGMVTIHLGLAGVSPRALRRAEIATVIS